MHAELVLGGDIPREALALHRHGMLVRLGDEEAALCPLEAAILVVDNSRGRRDLLRLLAHPHIGEVHL